MQPEKRLAAAIVMVCAGVSMPALTLAQSADGNTNVGQGKVVEQVIVTGSRVKRPEYEGNIPGVQTDAAQIELRNFNNAVDILNDIPLVGGGATPNGTNGGQPSSLGASFIDLLDLGTSRTLTLINGKRAVSGNAGSLFVFGNETGTQVNVNVIPTDLIERIDVLTVGGAVAYGSDAIAGVVNYIMKDDFEGMRLSTRVGQTDRGDGAEMAFRGTYGTNFAEGRGNVFVHADYSTNDGIQANGREFRNRNGGAITDFRNGSLRNPGFTATPGSAAFRGGAADGFSNNANLFSLTAANLSPGGSIFNLSQGFAAGMAPAGTQIGPFANTLTAGNAQLVPGAPGACVPGGAAQFCNFAPTALPAGVTAVQVLSAFGVPAPVGATPAQTTALANALAINVLQANRPTAREFFAQNPNTPLNLFLGNFLGVFPNTANTDPATQALFPRVANPIRFNNAGNVESFTVATLTPTTPSSIGGAVGGEGFNPMFNTVLRVKQERALSFFGGHYDITDHLRFRSENSYSDEESTSLRNGASANQQASGTVENAALIVNMNNPFLSDANKAALRAAGVGDVFVLSRTNQDIQADNRGENEAKTFRTSQGLEGDFELFSRTFDWDASFTYGRVEQKTRTRNIKDVEYALAIDAVRDASGNIVCRAQRDGAANVVGIAPNITRLPGPDGIPTERLDPATIRPTAAQIAACKPLNPFGFNQFSREARDYVLGTQEFQNTNEQFATQANLSFPVLTLPAGDVGFGASLEFREEKLDFTLDQLSANGRTRTAAIAATQGKTETTEYGAELRIPIFGGDWSFPALRALDIGGGVRRTTQDGSAPTYRNMAGQLVSQKAEGDPQNITSISANWSPIDSVRFRFERTRAVRQPNVVELFLGGQPAFNTPNDPCGSQSITGGPNPQLRRANCVADVIARGVRPDAATANAFLDGFTARNAALQGTFTGSSTLSPEKADSWTAGIVFTPDFVPGLRGSADYISIDLDDIIFPTNQTDALNFCFDSPQFPNNSASFGVNTCGLTRRDAGYNLDNGFMLGFLNLAATELRALNGTIEYSFDLGDLFGGGNLGTLGFDYNHYHLFAYRESGTGNFDDTIETQGSVGRARNESRLTTNYTRGPLTVQLTWQYTDHTKVFNGGAPANIEAFPVLELPSFSVYDVSASYRWKDKYRANFAVRNALDKNVLGQNGANISFVDQVGRRLLLTLTADFQ